MKTEKELKYLKEDFENMREKLSALSEEELKQVVGGTYIWDIAVKLKERFKGSDN